MTTQPPHTTAGDPQATPSVRQIHGWDHGYPDADHWAGWNPGTRIERLAREVADQIASTPTGRDEVRRGVEAVNQAALDKGGAVATTAIWVPDRGTGEVRGVLMETLRVFKRPQEASPEAFCARNWRRAYGGWRVRITERSAEIFECEAGRGVLETIVGRLRGERTVQAYSSFFVFPHDGTPEAVQLAFNTVHLDQLVELTVLGRQITNSLEITTGPAT